MPITSAVFYNAFEFKNGYSVELRGSSPSKIFICYKGDVMETKTFVDHEYSGRKPTALAVGN